MTNLWQSARLLLLDMASTFALLAVYLSTHNMPLAVGCGVAFGIIQIGLRFIRKQPIDTMQYLSLFLVVGSGAASLLTGDPRFVMLKPSVIYAVVGVVMLRPGWQNRYLPSIVRETVPDVAYVFGFVWAGLMFASAVLNIVVALTVSVTAWAAFMPIYAVVSKLALFLIQYGIMRVVTARRHRSGAVLAGG